MTKRSASGRPVVAITIVTGLAILTACGGNKPPPAQTTTGAATSSVGSSTTSARSTAFDPCTALTTDFLAEHQWNARAPEPKQTSTGAFTWKGCAYLAQARYSFGVQTTNGTLPQVREKFPTAEEFTVAGRKALRYEARPDVPGGCTINIEMTSGSLYILVDDPRGLHPRNLAPCDNATEIAEAVAPLLPSGN